MVALDAARFPLVEFSFVASAQNDWVALIVRPQQAPLSDALRALFSTPDLLAAVTPLDCLLPLETAEVLTPSLCGILPPNRVRLMLPGAALARESEARTVARLVGEGYAILVDGAAPAGVKLPAGLRMTARDCAAAAPTPVSPLFGPHLAYNVDSGERFGQCEVAGFEWFSGAYPLHMPQPESGHDGTSRRRLLTLLALVARDADTAELEQLLKQDPALSFHLLKLVNSAAFRVSFEITSFAQAIHLLGRRQLQRWLQLLLYARQRPDGLPNLLQPLAALRGAHLESLCRDDGGDRDEQDLSFMCGAFSLLDRLFDTPMEDIIGALRLPRHVLDALLRREGPLGQRLALVEGGADEASLARAAIQPVAWWRSQLGAIRWAIQVGRHV
jgi:EAL and modified HD-GYP domain-containing signal transduction protein